MSNDNPEWFDKIINKLERSIYVAAFVKALDEDKMQAGIADREDMWLRAHDFAIAAVDAFRGVRELTKPRKSDQ